MHPYIQDLLDKDIAFMGSDWVEDEVDGKPKDHMMAGYRYRGKKSCINCNDLFFWGSADSEDITEELIPTFQKAVEDCKGEEELGAWLYCARRRKVRLQGAAYSFIAEELWHIFDACGPEREVGLGNPYKPGDYKPCE